MAASSTTSSPIVWNDAWVRPSVTECKVTQHQIDTLVPGDGCKIKNPLGEKFWVMLIRKTDHGEFIGKVNNQLICGSDYNNGDHVRFNEQDIYDITTDTSCGKLIPELMPHLMAQIIHFNYIYGRMPLPDEMDVLNLVIRYHPN